MKEKNSFLSVSAEELDANIEEATRKLAQFGYFSDYSYRKKYRLCLRCGRKLKENQVDYCTSCKEK